MTLLVGYAKQVITPSLDRTVYLAGFGQNRRAESIHDNLYVCALSLSDGTTTLVLAALDLIGFFRRDVCEVIERVHARQPGVQILIASVHPHHGPDTLGLWGENMKRSGVDPVYMSSLKDKITATVLATLAKPKPAALKTACIRVPGVAKNARNPEILDEELTLAQFIGQDGKPLVTLFNFPCHPEVLWEHNPHITADYVGYLRSDVEEISQAPCIFFAGGLGGMMTPDVVEHSFEEAEAMGNVLAHAGLKALEHAHLQDGVHLSMRTRHISVRLTNVLYKLAFQRHLLPDARDPQGLVRSEVNLIKVGDLWLATVPGELLPKLGLSLKGRLRASGARVAGIIGLANDELGYILPPEDFKFPLNPFSPGKHYEETNSIGREIAPAVTSAFEELLQGEKHV